MDESLQSVSVPLAVTEVADLLAEPFLTVSLTQTVPQCSWAVAEGPVPQQRDNSNITRVLVSQDSWKLSLDSST